MDIRKLILKKIGRKKIETSELFKEIRGKQVHHFNIIGREVCTRWNSASIWRKSNEQDKTEADRDPAERGRAGQIKKKVEQSGKSQQQYIIEALTQKQVINTDGIKEIYPELKRQGNNLNQIAKKLNENGYVDYKHELPNTMKEVREYGSY